MPTWRIPIDSTWTGTSGSPGVNVFHGRTTGGAGPSADLEAMTDALEEFYSSIADLFCADVVFRWNGVASGVGDDTGDVATSPTWTVNGTNGSAHLPPANAVLVQWHTDGPSRSGRGRTFLSPMIDGLNEGNGTPEEAARTEIADAAAALVSESEGFANGALGVYSRTTDTFYDFTSSAVPNYFAVLRSRRD